MCQNYAVCKVSRARCEAPGEVGAIQHPCPCALVFSQEKKVACQSVVCDGALCSVDDFFVEYDHLIVSVGAPLVAPVPSRTRVSVPAACLSLQCFCDCTFDADDHPVSISG